jgi:hypothetical protein
MKWKKGLEEEKEEFGSYFGEENCVGSDCGRRLA